VRIIGAVMLSGAALAGCGVPPPPGVPGGVIPVAVLMVCPVSGATYVDSYGPREGGGFHWGIDLVAPTGTPVVAVRPGSLWHQPDPNGGNALYLFADDGNVYYYAHLDQYAGPDGPVAAGDVVGTVGMTGNASIPHLHFETRLGGVNGDRPNPYSSLRLAGC
jgi:murein DD-endopeptidase MepM/ murein hydrolase activator NlpD